jgi:hypothetical protein
MFKRLSFAVAALGLAASLAACGGAAAANPSTPKAPSPNATIPKAATAAEDANSVAQGMIRAGVPATVAFTYTAANDSNNLLGRQGGYSSKNSLQDQRLPKVSDWLSDSVSSIDGGASLECYPIGSGVQGAEQRYEYLKGFQGGLLGDGYDYEYGTCVLRLSNALTPPQAAQYESAFEAAARGGQ